MSELIKLGKNRINRISGIVRKEFSNLVTDKTALIILFIIPVVMITVVGSASVRADMMSVTLWIIDEDNSETSSNFINTFKNSSDLSSAHIYSSGEMAPIEPPVGQDEAWGEVNLENANKTIYSQYLDAFIILPAGFEAGIISNGTTKIIVYSNAIDFTNKYIGDAVILLGLTNVQLENMLFERDIFYFPEFRPKNIYENMNLLEMGGPFFIAMMLFFSINLICTQCIVGDIPLQRLLTTPVYRSEVITGKIISYTIISVFQIIISLLLLSGYNIPMNALWIDLFVLLLISSISSVCIGVFISTISKTRLQASQMFLLIFFIMMIGAFFIRIPVLLNLIPLEQTRAGFAELAYRGETMWGISMNLLKISLSALVFYILTIIYITKFKKEFI